MSCFSKTLFFVPAIVVPQYRDIWPQLNNGNYIEYILQKKSYIRVIDAIRS
jgi:hypothetical protein